MKRALELLLVASHIVAQTLSATGLHVYWWGTSVLLPLSLFSHVLCVWKIHCFLRQFSLTLC